MQILRLALLLTFATLVSIPQSRAQQDPALPTKVTNVDKDEEAEKLAKEMDEQRAKEAKLKQKEAEKVEKMAKKSDLKMEKAKEKMAVQNSASDDAKDKAQAKIAKARKKKANAAQRLDSGDASGKLSWKDYTEAGDALFLEGFYYDAIEYYKKARRLKPKSADIPCKIAESYYLVRDYKKSEDWYESVADKDPKAKSHVIDRLYYGLTLKQQGKYQLAMNALRQFLNIKSVAKKEKYKDLRLWARRERAGCKMAMAMVDTFESNKFKVGHLDRNFNSPDFEYAPFLKDGKTFLYAEMQADVYKTDKTEQLINPYSRVYSAVEIGGEWRPQDLLPGDFNSGKVHIGNAVLTPDSKGLYYTQCTQGGKPFMNCRIYKSEWSENTREWSMGEALPKTINVPGYTSMHPMLTTDADGNTVLYFASDQPGGKGRLDIWFTHAMPDGSFKKPKNAGKQINSSRDETTPFMHKPTKTLYFSSNGHLNVGGLDVFRSTRDDFGAFGRPINMQMPINSPSDDMYFALQDNSYTGMLSSNRRGGFSKYGETCCDDIYRVSSRPLRFGVSGTLFTQTLDKRSKAREGVVSLFDASNDSLIGSYVINTGEKFFFDVEKNKKYRVVAMCDGCDDKFTKFHTRGMTLSDTMTFDLVLNRDEEWKHKEEKLKNNWIGHTVGTVYFEYSKAHLTQEAPYTLDSVVRFIRKHPELLFEVGGHTDDRGMPDFNRNLSLDRAMAVRRYVLSKDIEPSRVSAQGYGESKPQVPNLRSDGSDNPDGRARNRRAEFKVVGELQEAAPRVQGNE